MKDSIISVKQHFLTRYASLLFVFIVFMVLGTTWFIRYPKLIAATAIIQRSDEKGLVYAEFVINAKEYHLLKNSERVEYAIRPANYAEPVFHRSAFRFVTASATNKEFRIQLNINQYMTPGSTIDILLKLNNPRLLQRIAGDISL